eukprot:330720-Karenia_brevis.AAC.1
MAKGGHISTWPRACGADLNVFRGRILHGCYTGAALHHCKCTVSVCNNNKLNDAQSEHDGLLVHHYHAT